MRALSTSLIALGLMAGSAACSTEDDKGTGFPKGVELIEVPRAYMIKGRSVAGPFPPNALCSEGLSEQWIAGVKDLREAIRVALIDSKLHSPRELIVCNHWAVEQTNRMMNKCSEGIAPDIQLAVAGNQLFWRQAYIKAETVYGESKLDAETGLLRAELAFKNTGNSVGDDIHGCEKAYENFMLTNF